MPLSGVASTRKGRQRGCRKHHSHAGEFYILREMCIKKESRHLKNIYIQSRHEICLSEDECMKPAVWGETVSMQRKLILGLGSFLAIAAPAAAAQASAITINYYTIGETDKDANHLAMGTFNNEVTNSLGPDGLPVLNPAANGGVGLPTDLTKSGEITYWSPTLNNGGAGGTSDVTFTGSSAVALPFDVPANFFPPNGTGPNDSNGFQAATLSGTLLASTTEAISFSIGADDMAFAYLDGNLVCDLGGVHASTAGTCVSPFDITAGSHSLEVFFADINNTESGLTFAVTTQGVIIMPTNPVPEPASLAVVASGLLGLGVLRRRKNR